ncbi:IS4 family transposase [Nitrosomonas ureae]|uniref:Transposase DDE domain-containing protein n=10 Tax=Pseudomonadota TaxID=1224 RepID=A0A0S3AJ79_9PROT|nr:IS4 family transposase [Nitrosomonas ureae]ALQ50573.1 transposase [Nitrosomonas ureae]ALQ51126.1 transposase [Nitrosomonas ureae]ALQ51141.1 transposase [Nitrosomonas ureae]ALQ51627.1 transposase [Nitrosomonas ureae]ALQ51686.1 transposase [Nitrosomonas ureae]
MHSGKLVFAQLMDYLPLHTFRRCVQRYPSKYPTKTLSHLDQFLCMAFAQLTYRESLRNIETCLRAHQAKLYHLGIRGNIAKSTLADANEQRDCRIYMDFAMSLIQIARKLYSSDSLAVELEQTVYALDTTTIDLCLSVFPWARFRQTKAAVKMHTLLDLRGNIPTFIHISDGKMHEVNVLDFLIPEAGSFYIMDRGFTDFARWFTMHQAQAFFVTRAKSSLLFRRVYSHSVDKSTGLRCDQTIALTATKASKDYPQHLRRIKFYDAEHDKHLVFLTNNFDLPALTIAQLYRCRWQIELFFKWIKQHLRIKQFYGTTENAVKTQIWIAISVYVLVAIVKKRLNTETSLYTILQILSLTLFEKTNLDQLLKNTEMQMITHHNNNQLNLFN